VRALRWFPWFICAAVFTPLLFRTQADPDLWGHLRFGLDLIHTHHLPLIDPYSFTQDIPWINHEWLAELVMGATYWLTGAVGVAVLKAVIVALIFIVVLGPYLDARPFIGAGAFLLLAIGSGRVISTLRPQLMSLLAFALLCRLLSAGARRSWLVVLPTLFALWVNLHGGWIVGAAVLAMWVVVNFWQASSSRALTIGAASLSAVATLMNPYGWRLLDFLAQTVRPSRGIVEWQPLFTTPRVAWVPALLVTAGLICIPFVRKRPPIDRLAIVVALGFAAFRVERLSSFFIVAALILLSPTIREQWPPRPFSFKPLSVRKAAFVGVASIVMVVVSATLAAREASCVTISGDWTPDRVAGRALTDAHVSGKMVTWFDWGEYEIWHLGPQVRVSLDGRRETVYSDAVLKGHDELDAGTREGLAYLQDLQPDYVWLPAMLTSVSEWLAGHGYRIDVQTPRSFVAVRENLPVVHASDAPLPACFPGP